MRKVTAGIVSLALVLAFSGMSLAEDKKNQPEALAEITPMGCSEVDISPFGTSLLVAWDWFDGTDQTKFGGDAVYMVNSSVDGVDYQWLAVEIEVDRYEVGTPAEDYAGKLVYRCSNEQTDPSGSCNGAVLGLEEALLAAAAEELESEVVYISEYLLQWVYVKALNPSLYPVNKRQNFPLVDVCAAGDGEPEEPEEPEDPGVPQG